MLLTTAGLWTSRIDWSRRPRSVDWRARLLLCSANDSPVTRGVDGDRVLSDEGSVGEMMSAPEAMADAAADGERAVLLAFLAEHRRLLREKVLTLSDEEARRRLVPSLTTPMGLLKHAAFVERVWFVSRFGGLSRAEVGIPDTVDESFLLEPEDSLEGIARDHEPAVVAADAVIARLSLEDRCTHPVMGELTLRWVLTHCIRELAQHSGHADILVEQIRTA